MSPDRNDMTTEKRHLGSRAARMKILGLLTTVWIGLALQPCAVAAVSNEDCAHSLIGAKAYSRPADAQCDLAVQRQIDDHTRPVTTSSNCCDLDERIVNQRVDDFGSNLIALIVPPSVPDSLIRPGLSEEPGNAADPPESSGGPVPLHILKCVYLD